MFCYLYVLLFDRSSNTCRRYGLIRDTVSSDQSITLCGTDTRISHVYLSKSHVVRIWITAGLAPRDLQRFIIEYHGQCCWILILNDVARCLVLMACVGYIACMTLDAVMLMHTKRKENQGHGYSRQHTEHHTFKLHCPCSTKKYNRRTQDCVLGRLLSLISKSSNAFFVVKGLDQSILVCFHGYNSNETSPGVIIG